MFVVLNVYFYGNIHFKYSPEPKKVVLISRSDIGLYGFHSVDPRLVQELNL